MAICSSMASSSTAAPGAEIFGRFCDVPVGPGPESLRLEESMVLDNSQAAVLGFCLMSSLVPHRVDN